MRGPKVNKITSAVKAKEAVAFTEGVEAFTDKEKKSIEKNGYTTKVQRPATGMGSGRYKLWPFNPTLSARICYEVQKGHTVEQIGKKKGFPPAYIIKLWTRTNRKFYEEMQQARRERAEYFHDQIIEIANGITKKSEVAVAKTKLSAFKWAAEKGNPEQYGQKQIHEGNPDKPITILIDTGIRRDAIDVSGSSQGLAPVSERLDQPALGSPREVTEEIGSSIRESSSSGERT